MIGRQHGCTNGSAYPQTLPSPATICAATFTVAYYSLIDRYQRHRHLPAGPAIPYNTTCSAHRGSGHLTGQQRRANADPRPWLSSSPAVNTAGALTTLASTITSTGATSITVANAATIGQTTSGISTYIWVGSEEMLVTAVNTSTNVLTVQRGVNGTTAATASSGASVYLGNDQRGFARVPAVSDIGASSCPP